MLLDGEGAATGSTLWHGPRASGTAPQAPRTEPTPHEDRRVSGEGSAASSAHGSGSADATRTSRDGAAGADRR